jgi:hypothetical protein
MSPSGPTQRLRNPCIDRLRPPQKAFANCPLPPAHTEKLRRHPKQIKVFWFFFSKKNTFLAFLPVLFQ